MSTTCRGSGGIDIKRGEYTARVRPAPDGQWRVDFQGRTSHWPTEAEAEMEANHLLRQVAGLNAYREGARFGEDDPGEPK